MKITKESKQGISLIVLVITIILMIILAATVIISLNDNGIISNANNAVAATNLANVKQLASVKWAEAFFEGKTTQKEFNDYVTHELAEAGIKLEDYILIITEKGVEVYEVKEQWIEVYTGDSYTEEGMLLLGENKIFNNVNKFRITIQSDEYTGQIVAVPLYNEETGVYVFGVIENEKFIYYNSLEDFDSKVASADGNISVVGGTYMQEEGMSASILIIEATCDYKVTKIEELVTYNTYIEEDCDIAYTYLNGVWNDTPILNGGFVQADIVAKFYKTDEILEDFTFGTVNISGANGYRLELVGKGIMGDLSEGAAWTKPLFELMATSNEEIAERAIGLYVTEITVLGEITNIPSYSFYYFVNLRSIELNSSITQIADSSFVSCVNLKSIIIPDSVTDLGSAFLGCSSLKSVTLSKNITEIKNKTFYECLELSSIVIPDGVTSIGDHVFDLTSLEKITIPKSVIEIGDDDASFTLVVYYKGTQEEWSKINIDDGNNRFLNATVYYNSK